jgi:hypothetical protein
MVFGVFSSRRDTLLATIFLYIFSPYKIDLALGFHLLGSRQLFCYTRW